MADHPVETRRVLEKYGQAHLLTGWELLSSQQRQDFLAELLDVDFARLQREHAGAGKKTKIPDLARIEPIPRPPAGASADAARRLGEEALARGEVAVILVAGGRGSRLGFEKPKGMFPIGPVTRKSLFQIHAEKIRARAKRHATRIPLLVLTSHVTHDETVAYFAEHHLFGLPKDDVFFFQQGTNPVLAKDSFKLLLDGPGRLSRSPDGHGGTLPALQRAGLLDEMQRRGVRHFFYFQVDNPLVKIADPLFVGQHVQADSEASIKVVPKEKPTDKIGNLVLVDGRCSIVEYHEPSDTEVWAKKGDRYIFSDGNTAIHLFSLAFFQRLLGEGFVFPYHMAAKKVPHVNVHGQLVMPEQPNALQLETFIFDTLPQAQRTLAVETTHAEEFAPLKNSETDPVDNPVTVRRAISAQAARWLAQAGITLPAADEHMLEIGPLFALEPGDVRARLAGSLKVHGSMYLG